MGLVCFRLKGVTNEINQKLLSNINASGKLHMVPACVHGRFVIRFCVCAADAKDCDIEFAWDVITEIATELLEAETVKEKSGVALDVLDNSNQEVGQRSHKVEMSELMELMERVHLPVQKQSSSNSLAGGGIDKDLRHQNTTDQQLDSITVTSPKLVAKQKLSKQLSKRQFSFTESIEFVGMVNTNQEESMNP